MAQKFYKMQQYNIAYSYSVDVIRKANYTERPPHVGEVSANFCG
jgi:hypothetical protein